MMSACIPAPSELLGRLFADVQTRRLFSDGKIFADAEPRRPVAHILAEHDAREWDNAALASFVLANFFLPPAPAETACSFPSHCSLKAHITDLWDTLARPPHNAALGSSALSLANSYVVPGGRFREIYYWDSYYTMIGLRCDKRSDLLEGLINNFTDLIERYGRIPNGTRTYCLSRSQPPHYALMVELSAASDDRVAHRRLAAMRREHDFWMTDCAHLAPGQAAARVVRLSDGALLNRYWDDRCAPRDESMLEDILVAEQSGRMVGDVYRELRAGAESGWDFSSRWFSEDGQLGSIRTTQIAPFDLNCLLYASERVIERQCKSLGLLVEASRYAAVARQRRAAIRRWLWSRDEQRFGDLDLLTGELTSSVNAGVAYALFSQVATQRQAAATTRSIRDRLLASGGLRTTLIQSGEQWDSPNGWAPLQWAAIKGLRRYGYRALARRIAERWVSTVNIEFRRSGRLLEKYNVEERLPGEGGEYSLQYGFGWTNGVVRALYDFYPDLRVSDG